jgi:Bacterial antitoxin of type II TA system, VapB
MHHDLLLMQEHVTRTTLTIDDELFAQALSLLGPGIEKSELLKECRAVRCCGRWTSGWKPSLPNWVGAASRSVS